MQQTQSFDECEPPKVGGLVWTLIACLIASIGLNWLQLSEYISAMSIVGVYWSDQSQLTEYLFNSALAGTAWRTAKQSQSYKAFIPACFFFLAINVFAIVWPHVEPVFFSGLGLINLVLPVVIPVMQAMFFIAIFVLLFSNVSDSEKSIFLDTEVPCFGVWGLQ